MSSLSRQMLLVLASLFCLADTCIALAAADKSLHFFIGGLGYCGSRIALKLRQEFPDCEISGCVRSKERKKNYSESDWGVKVHVLDLDENYNGLDEEGMKSLSQATHIVQTVAPIADFDRDPLLALHGCKLEESPSLRWVGYPSSTGVYGDHGGNWVDESSELRCQDAQSLARIKAEAEWRKLEETRQHNDHKTRIDCFRCGGIYGPGRNVLFSASRTTAEPEPKDVPDLTPKYVNRILVDDICGAILAAIKANIEPDRHGGRVYNLVDDDPAPRRDVMNEARKLVSDSNGPNPDMNGAFPPSRRRPSSRNTGNKRCRNQLLKDDYQWMPVAPTYREGLALLREQQALQP